jgi:hypothetical protein
MAISVRSRLVAGGATDYVGGSNGLRKFESAQRRGMRLMCQNCLKAKHDNCESEECPCVCNDSDFRWARKPKLTGQP